jgi:hypothetical protein
VTNREPNKLPYFFRKGESKMGIPTQKVGDSVYTEGGLVMGNERVLYAQWQTTKLGVVFPHWPNLPVNGEMNADGLFLWEVKSHFVKWGCEFILFEGEFNRELASNMGLL